jgi:hypothetical protein
VTLRTALCFPGQTTGESHKPLAAVLAAIEQEAF